MTGVVPPPSRAGAPTGPGSRTLRVLQTYLAFLLLAVIAMPTAVLWTLHRISDHVEEVRTRTAPALLEISESRRALAAADAAAVESFAVGDPQLIGLYPGMEYRKQFGIANQSLARVVEVHPLGEEGSHVLQTVEGLLASYADWIGRASAHFRQKDAIVLGLLDLWNATRLMHEGEKSILGWLGELQEKIKKKMEPDRRPVWMEILWSVPVAVFLVSAVSAQIYLSRRFRRRVNVWLATATGIVLVGLPLLLCQVVGSRNDLAGVRGDLSGITGSKEDSIARSDGWRRHTLAGLLSEKCTDGCGAALDGFIRSNGGPPPRKPERGSAIWHKKEAERIASAVKGAQMNGLTPSSVPTAAAVVLLLVVLGFYPRIDEYRFQPR